LKKEKLKCLVLSRTGNKSPAASGKEKETVYNPYALELYNQGMYALVNFLSLQMDMQPAIVDETGYSGKIDIQLNCKLSDPAAVNKALSKYGLQLKEEEREKGYDRYQGQRLNLRMVFSRLTTVRGSVSTLPVFIMQATSRLL
jgi:hypothetical protein